MDLLEEEDVAAYHAQDIARSAFADMVQDTERNELYEAGIKWAIGELRKRGHAQVVVLDIGTGSGLLSMLAARHGADVIYACDAFPPAVYVAKKVIASNGYAGRIKLIPKMSTDLQVGPGLDLERRANLLVAELFDTELIGEGLIRSYSDAQARLLTQDCLMVPQTATIYSQLVESRFLRSHHTVPSFGLKMSEEIDSCFGTASLHDIQLSQLDESDFVIVQQPQKCFHFDLKNILSTPTQFSYEVPAATGQNDGSRFPCVLMWWTCKMAPGIVLSCAPHWEHPQGRKQPWRDHWMQAVYYPRTKHGRWLQCLRDEFSLWFDLVDDPSEVPRPPACTCGVHYSVPRSRLAQLHDPSYYRLFRQVVESCPEPAVVLVGDGSLTLPLALARDFPGKKFFILDSIARLRPLAERLIRINRLDNCVIFDKDQHRDEVELVLMDPFSHTAHVPWMTKITLDSLVESMGLGHLRRLPATCRLMGIEVDFENLHKIRSRIVETVGLNMADYDRLIQDAMSRCDSPVEPQPLWEYPGVAQSAPFQLADEFQQGQEIQHRRTGTKGNGLALWVDYSYGKDLVLSHGPAATPKIGEVLRWNRYVKQGVMLDVAELEVISFNIDPVEGTDPLETHQFEESAERSDY